MAGEIIRPKDLTPRPAPVASELMVVDNSVNVGASTIKAIVEAGRPAASQTEAQAGTDAAKAMTPLTTKQSIASEVGVSLASKAQGDLAATAVQPGSLATVATSGAYGDLSGKPDLGTAAATDASAYATAAQGGKADTAVQSIVPGSNTTIDNTDPRNPVVSSTGGVADGNKGDVTVSGGGNSWGVNDGAVTDPKLANSLKAKLVGVAATRSALAAILGSTYLVVDLIEVGRNGLFMWDGSNLTARVTADPGQGVYVPPASAPTGASGAWVRQFDGDVQADWFGLIMAGTPVANTTAINRAINLADVLNCGVELPGIEFDINAGVGGGIVVKTGTRIRGHGWLKTIINLRNGGSLAQLRNYQAGAGIRREFVIDGQAKSRVKDVLIEHLAVVMNHPLTSLTSTDIQIGIDFRNITRSEVRHCWVGNYHPINDTKGGTRPYLCQGWVWVAGNESGGPDYAGGECNTFRRNFVAGAWRAVAIDDNILNPVSAAYSQRILENDIQIAQILVYQASQYGAGNVTRDNTLQSVSARQDDASGNICLYWTGYGNMSEEPYIEAGSTCTYILRYGGSARRNRAKFSATCSATGGLTAAFSDGGGGSSYNVVEFFANTGAAGTHNSQGSPQRMVSGTTTTVT